jgi:hypothetical protein
MDADFSNWLVLAVSVGLAFLAARWGAARWRARHRHRSEQVRRAGESRQVRRARQRQGKGE